ncbi:cilia- and flagella-associated protein 206-like isoform X2 [Dysidea avara]|uniref:cilia- and flagella-associated protein 206-like isoform X2 n=1 Tax=Dysidea avara TaxID=196820 RepID=UPI00331BDCD1
MSSVQAESVIKSIIREISTECNSRGVEVSETLIAFTVKAAVLDPDNEFSVDRALTKTDVQHLIQSCVKKLQDSSSPSLDTVKMQVNFDMNYTSRAEFLEEHRRILETRLQPITREITDYRARTREELETLYRKIVSYILLQSGLGSPTDIAVVREATAALQSVFPQTELGTFMIMSKPDKERQLKELTSIVTGIRLFNRNCGKGGEGIDDLPSVLKEAIQTASQTIEAELAKTLQCVFKLTAILLHVISSPHQPPTSPTPLLMKNAIINLRQHQAYIKVLMGDILNCVHQVTQLEKDYDNKMSLLKDTVQSKTAVPTAQVYPLFVSLAKVWGGYQDNVVMLSVLSNLLTGLRPFVKQAIAVGELESLQTLLNEVQVLTDEERITQTTGADFKVDIAKHRKAEFIFPETTQNFDQISIEFKTFCCYCLGAHDRYLLPANTSLGVLHYKGRYFTFSSREAADAFAADPEKYITLVVTAARRSPELINLLCMHHYVASGSDSSLIHAPVTKRDSGTQTDTHFMESNIVKSYEWNEWELRRKAIKLTNLRNKITHSTQTDFSHYKRDNTTQVYLPKDNVTQTKRDHGTSVPAPSVYLAGLRGKDIPYDKVDLTLDINTHNTITD